MKKTLFSLTILSFLFIASCGSDDGTEIEVALEGALAFNGTTINISDGLFGEVADGGEYAATFFLSDAPLTFNAETEQASFQGDYLVNVIIYSEADAFESGNYDIATLDSPVSDKSAFVVIADVDNASTGGMLANGGTVNIQGDGSTFTLTFVVDFENEIELTGNVSGTFERVNISL